MARRAPRLVVLAGPNGAGKSTTAAAILREALAVHEFVNADTIAQGLSAFDEPAAAIRAGRIMLERIRQLGRERQDFAFETTLASRSLAHWIAHLRIQGYRVEIVFLRLASAELAVARVACRVRSGGHGVPEAIIRRRFERGLKNLHELYLPLADSCLVLDSSGAAPGGQVPPDARRDGSGSQTTPLGTRDPLVSAAALATSAAIRRHRHLGQPIATWCDGKVVILRAGEIPDELKYIEVTARLKLQIIDCLRELSDRKEQERLWSGTGNDGSEISSFSEAFCCLFDDTGLREDLEKGTRGLGAEAETALRQLYAQLRKIDPRAGPNEIIESIEMARVRELAAISLRLVEPDA